MCQGLLLFMCILLRPDYGQDKVQVREKVNLDILYKDN